MKYKSVFINLISSHSLEHFPNNNSSHFSNVLQNPLHLDDGSYEVGVCEIFFHSDKIIEDKPDFTDTSVQEIVFLVFLVDAFRDYWGTDQHCGIPYFARELETFSNSGSQNRSTGLLGVSTP
jgi:hypothetical protein